MALRFRTRWPLFALACAAVFFLYFFGLTRAGMLSADEPRYAAIGRAMADTGDWITPRLWGQAWFEKPVLLYWLTALGFRAGLDDDLAPRLPLALLSVAFLAFFFNTLRRDYGPRIACYATAILATSIGWLAYSHVAVTDLPLSACFAAAMLLADKRPSVAGVLLGLAILAKGLVPLILFLPALWFLRLRAVRILTIAVLVAAPWYALVTLRNGTPFLTEFFWKHHFARFTTGALQHERPFWFYVPVILAGLFPWTPLALGLFRRELYQGRREQFLLAWVLFGFVFFSASRNKLPGYVLPLLPALAILLALALTRSDTHRWTLALTAVLLWLIPVIADMLPQALLTGISRVPISFSYALLAPMLILGGAVWWLASRGHRDLAVAAITLVMTILVAQVIWSTYPVLDRTVSARFFWRAGPVECVESNNRSWRYGINYYARRVVPDCIPSH